MSDASDLAIGGVLLQQDEEGDWHPVAYTSRRLRPEECNYHAMEREALATIHAIQTLKLYLFKPFELVTDNRRVTVLKSKSGLSKREASLPTSMLLLFTDLEEKTLLIPCLDWIILTLTVARRARKRCSTRHKLPNTNLSRQLMSRWFGWASLHILPVRWSYRGSRAFGTNFHFLSVFVASEKKFMVQGEDKLKGSAQANLERNRQKFERKK